MRVAWGLTGSGDKFRETYEVMRALKQEQGDELKIDLYLSRAAEQVSKFYKLESQLKAGFDKYFVERDANTPFISGMLQTGKYDLLLIAPVTGNTVAKIAIGIADTLISNAAIQAVKGFVPVYIMPVDFREGVITTTLPNGDSLKLRVRKEDAENVRRLEKMEGFHVFENPDDIPSIIKMS
ncbi:archaeoflavoprotein AfpA [Candidatus Bathyarchaeota archaeon]|jgi:archaeoflavoprotein AfpA|nr:archaeoflavoprotein AfpA [Candidatus Bathyarchaeota archaeon]MBT4319142.1 archaeoflavoprotein AfpA [Candidatus Bathyarchaeota archaeon]MBT4423444.1 archaeoflavoprotein AfpA [Candidatus Bathyarchaeota archaeon]MBT6605400.1 archaeoflavoprotein AfpA [Candidatus Bathyarchaeota archaeon]MBT7186375.1 archaeoflavoprotein AfpA [Candidatus Bathyarchaeota archaeon]